MSRLLYVRFASHRIGESQCQCQCHTYNYDAKTITDILLPTILTRFTRAIFSHYPSSTAGCHAIVYDVAIQLREQSACIANTKIDVFFFSLTRFVRTTGDGTRHTYSRTQVLKTFKISYSHQNTHGTRNCVENFYSKMAQTKHKKKKNTIQLTRKWP